VQATRQELSSLYKSADLAFASGGADYHVTHGEWHPIFSKMVRERKLGDLYLLDIDGNVLYSVSKATDFATKVAADGGLGQAFEAAKAKPNEVSYVNLNAYVPTGGQAAFFATGIHDAEGNLVGVYVIRPPAEYEESIEYSQ